MNKSNKNKVLAILGMHRSGTSLLSNWLHDCGLNLGDNMFGGNEFNSRGHFEDWDFLDFHNKIIRDNNLDFFVTESDSKNIKLPNNVSSMAESIVDSKNKLHDQWGWKDPRTCLFVDVWAEVIPTADYFIVFRNYLNCVDSLLRRYIKKEINKNKSLFFKQRKNTKIRESYMRDSILINKFCESWYFHNKKLLKLIKEKKNDSEFIVIENSMILPKSSVVFTNLTEVLGYDLQFKDPGAIIDEKLMRSTISFDSSVVKQSSKYEDLLNELRSNVNV